jgi:ribosomal peptide maturation radical SAM protein 1
MVKPDNEALEWKAGSFQAQRSVRQVVLVCMPFMDAYCPSIQVGLLTALATAHGFPARSLHANLDFAAQIGLDYYQRLSEHRGHMVGEWLFSLDAFPNDAPDPDSRMLDELACDLSHLAEPHEDLKKKLIRTRYTDVPLYLDALVESFPWEEVAVVGFSSTFQQNTASFALARRLKQRYPHIFTVFGGANFDDEMGPELVRTIDCIDAAVIGEGDDAFPGLLEALAEGSDLGLVPGLARRLDGKVTVTPASPPRDQLDNLPMPDYEEYFEHAEELGILPKGNRNVWLPIETARGCWWGAKHHCTFCGLNGTSMSFRSKTPERVLDELSHQARKYRSCYFEAVDNILDPTYLKRLFPALAESEVGYQFFYEVKSNLSREQLRLLAQAGVTRIQPGLESLSSHVLDLMRKGVRAAQNVNLLRWARYYDINAEWNLLWGFPGETELDYAEQAAVIPHLVHLQPPSNMGRIWLERFSPLFDGQGVRQIVEITPERSYRYVYPRDVDLSKVAYFFDYQLEGGIPESSYAEVQRAVTGWSEAWAAGKPPLLTYWSAPHFVQICDQRWPEHMGTYTFEDTLADLYLACLTRPTTAAAVQRKLDLALPVEAVQELFIEFRDRGLMFLDGQFALALALPAIKMR